MREGDSALAVVVLEQRSLLVKPHSRTREILLFLREQKCGNRLTWRGKSRYGRKEKRNFTKRLSWKKWGERGKGNTISKDFTQMNLVLAHDFRREVLLLILGSQINFSKVFSFLWHIFQWHADKGVVRKSSALTVVSNEQSYSNWADRETCCHSLYTVFYHSEDGKGWETWGNTFSSTWNFFHGKGGITLEMSGWHMSVCSFVLATVTDIQRIFSLLNSILIIHTTNSFRQSCQILFICNYYYL